jgi:hypothetical protein
VTDETAVGSEVMQGVWERRNNQGIQILRVHYSADPERDPNLNPEWYSRERKKYSSQGVWDREQEIIYEAGGGERLFSHILSKYKHKIVITDPLWRPNPFWRQVGGFDHGKRNPTAGLVVYVDEDGCKYACGEYYMPGLGPRQNAENLRQLPNFYQARTVFADPTIFHETQAQPDGSYKSINQLYVEAGLVNMCAAVENDELTGMERILDHWHNGDLDDKEPTLKIVCRKPYDKRRDGLYPYDCPNLLWELMRTRREELTAQQLMRRNPTEKIVDKDNHQRDSLKYVLLSLPKAAEIPIEHKIAMATRDMNPMNQYLTAQKMLATERQMSKPILTGGTALRRGIGLGKFGRR